MRYPSQLDARAALRDTTMREINGKWVPARPAGNPSFWSRIRCAWAVFTGRADALKWPGQ